MLAGAHHVLGPGVADDRGEALRLGHGPGRDEALGQPLGRLLHRGRDERDDDVLGLHDVAQLHRRSWSSGTTSAGRFMTAMPARAKAAIFSAAPPISPIRTTASVSGSAWNADRHWRKVVPIRGSPPMPMQVD